MKITILIIHELELTDINNSIDATRHFDIPVVPVPISPYYHIISISNNPLEIC